MSRPRTRINKWRIGNGLALRTFSCRATIGLSVLAAGLFLASRGQLIAAETAAPADPVSFNRTIRPILSDYCFRCHGADDQARKAKLRLDQRESALRPDKDGGVPVNPGKPDQSELVKRINSTDPDEVMPPPSIKKLLSADQKRALRDWVAAGAAYEPHWAFVPPRQEPPPSVRQQNWSRNPIDRFILARLEKEGLHPSPAADPYTLVRRVYLDLIGLPPTPEEADAFVNDHSPDALEKLADRLLASPQYGERWARRWLDLARYADTNGYEKDRVRSIWPYRDWVIRAINEDMPFDQFTIKQLAGDLLPQATIEDRIATGFHRNTMLNEEGGIDPLEFRFYSLVDRVATTGTTWLGLTIGCAQCHTHKYDPISQREYYQFMAFLDNTEEPEIPVPDPKIDSRREEQEAKIRELERHLAGRFPVEQTRFLTVDGSVTTASGDQPELLPGGSWRFAGRETNTYWFSFTNQTAIKPRFIRLDALADDSLPSKGPGRHSNGNFVLSEIQVTISPPDAPAATNILKLVNAKADFSQDEFSVEKAIDGDPRTGWAVDPKQGHDHYATFDFENTAEIPAGTHWMVRLDQKFGSEHVLGRARLRLGEPVEDPRPLETRRKEALDQRFAAWEKLESSKAVKWTALKASAATSNEPILTPQEDASIVASGDQTKSDTYEIGYSTSLKHITAIRLEALADPNLPGHGPGRTYYEGTPGDFLLCEFGVTTGGQPVKFKSATQDYPHEDRASGHTSAELTFDGDPLTGWSIGGGVGKSHAAVYILEHPLDAAGDLQVKLHFERYFASDLGRFRISVTTDDLPAEARGLPAGIEAIAAKPAAERSSAEREALFQRFLEVVPELADARHEIQKAHDKLARFPTTLVMAERPAGSPRKTHIHHRGEFLQTKDEVTPGVPAFLPPLPADAPKNRLTFAKWLVSAENPLTARVTMNRQWQAFFGRGLVRTLEDFGYQGAAPSHPELLDWMAVEFMRNGWSMKYMHRLIVTSATYQQSSEVQPVLAEKDPENILLARGPRFRAEAEVVRDSALRASGLLSAKLGGPSVFPPQPAGVTTEGAYGQFTWTTSPGEDHYRRSLYTFAKRTTPFAFYSSFDAPSGEICVARREVSDTPLQALTLLNDVIMMEGAQALGKSIAKLDGAAEAKAAALFRRCLTRPPTGAEQAMLTEFYSRQKARLEKKEIDAAKLAGLPEGEALEAAAWTTVARAVLNLDEAVTKE